MARAKARKRIYLELTEAEVFVLQRALNVFMGRAALGRIYVGADEIKDAKGIAEALSPVRMA